MVDPVALRAGGNFLPRGAVDSAVGDDLELLRATEVLTDVVVVNLARAGVVRVLDADEDSYGVAAAAAEDLAAFSAGQFPCGGLVAAQVVDVDVAVVLSEGEADAVCGVAVDPAAVGNKGDNASVANAVCSPSESADVGVVEGALTARARPLGVGLFDASVEGRVLGVGV